MALCLVLGPSLAQDKAANPAGDALVPAAACAATVVTAAASGFSLMCGKRVPAGIFLGSYLSPDADNIGACIKRCAANDKCVGFSLDNQQPPASRVCTLFGSIESLADAQAWVTGTSINNPPSGATGTGNSGGGHWHHHAAKKASGHFAEKLHGRAKNITPELNAAPNDSGSGNVPVALSPDIKGLQPVYFATDRKPVSGAPLEASFGAERTTPNNLSYGSAIVSIPKSHSIGNVERPKFRYLKWSYEAETDADHFRIKAITPLDRAGFVSELEGGADSILLFIHGYNVSFADAVFKAAQIAFDANFPGTVLVFSWPSAGELLKYDYDHDSAEFAVPDLAKVYSLLANEIGKKNVYIVAHSMGNQALVSALELDALTKANLTISELVMAAPDVDKDVFGSKVNQIRTVANNITLYASAADKALLASSKKSFDTRLGFVGPSGPNIFPGVDVIDVTAVGDDMLGLDHSTFSSSRAVLDDLGHLIRSITHLAPDARTPTLKIMQDTAHEQYWLYPQ
jgi:esterase/lipase superfamily enzyme